MIVVECEFHREVIEITGLSPNRGFSGVAVDFIDHPVMSWNLTKFFWKHSKRWCQIVYEKKEE